jgi:hypothetical protein
MLYSSAIDNGIVAKAWWSRIARRRAAGKDLVFSDYEAKWGLAQYSVYIAVN